MKVKVVDMHELLSELLGVPVAQGRGDMTHNLQEKIKRRMEGIERYKKNLVGAIGTATTEVIGLLNANVCEHHEHRLVPDHSDDMAAIYNVLQKLHSIYEDSYSVALHELTMCANRMIDTQEDVPPNPGADALQSVLKMALSIFIAAIIEHSPNATAVMKTFNQRLPETMSRYSEELMTGKRAAREGSDEQAKACRH